MFHGFGLSWKTLRAVAGVTQCDDLLARSPRVRGDPGSNSTIVGARRVLRRTPSIRLAGAETVLVRGVSRRGVAGRPRAPASAAR